MSSNQTSARAGAWLLSGLALLGVAASAPQAAARMKPQGRGKSESARKALQGFAGYGRLPLSFEENRGQADAAVKFLARGAGYGLYLSPAAAVLALDQSVLRMEVVGANPEARVRGEGLRTGTVNYLAGKDRAAWRTGIPTRTQVRMQEVYPGIDLVYYGAATGADRRLEYDFVLQPGALPETVKLRFQGTERAELSPEGDLLLHLADGVVRQPAPVVYQEEDGRRKAVEARYVLAGDEVSFVVGRYNRSRPLIIDPILQYSTYLGGVKEDTAEAIAVDAVGNAYITGTTWSANFPVKNPFQARYKRFRDVFVSKLNTTGSALLYSTYLSGTADEEAFGIAVDGAGSAYVTGATSSPDFPTANALQPEIGNAVNYSDAFVTKLSPDGKSLVYSTYLGGAGSELARGIDVDPNGNAYLCGLKSGPVPPPPGADVPPPGKPGAAAALPEGEGSFVTKLNAAGTALVYTYFLVERTDIFDIDVDADGAAYIAGGTNNANFPTTPGALQETDPDAVRDGSGNVTANKSDGFAAKLNPAGDAFEYATYLGGAELDLAVDVAVDPNGNAVVGGVTESPDFPLQNPAQGTLRGVTDAFLVKLNPAGSGLIFGTFFGGEETDNATSVAVAADGTALLAGYTPSTDIPLQEAIQDRYRGDGENGLGDAFLARYNPEGALTFSTYLGGQGDDAANDVAAGPAGSVFLAGTTSSRDFLVQSPLQSINKGRYDAFVTRIGETPVEEVRLRVKPGNVRFGVVRSGRTKTKEVKLKNPSAFPVTVSVGSLDAPFSLQGGGNFVIPARDTHTLFVTFAPTVRGTFQDTLEITTNSSPEPITIPIAGAGR